MVLTDTWCCTKPYLASVSCVLCDFFCVVLAFICQLDSLVRLLSGLLDKPWSQVVGVWPLVPPRGNPFLSHIVQHEGRVCQFFPTPFRVISLGFWLLLDPFTGVTYPTV